MLSIRLKASALISAVGLLTGALAAVAQGPPSVRAPGPLGTRVIVKPDTVFFHAVGNRSLRERRVRIQRLGPPPVEELTFKAEVSTTSGGGWLDATPLEGPIPSTLTLTADPGMLEPGTYEGQVTVTHLGTNGGQVTLTSSGTDGTPHVVNVVLRVLAGPGDAPTVFVRPRKLTFRMAEGGDNPDPRTLTVSSPTGGEAFSWAATHMVDTPPGGDWLKPVEPPSDTGPGTITVTVDGSELSAGQYSGSITVTSGDTSVQVPVMLLVRPAAPANLVIHPRAFNFIVHPGAPPPASKTLNVKTAGSGSLEWTAVADSNGGMWLSIPPNGGTTPATIEITANPAGLAPGHYQGTVQVTAGDQTRTARVFLRIVGQPGSGDGDDGDGDGANGDGDGPPPNVNQTAVHIAPPVVNFTSTDGTTAPASVAVRVRSRLSGLTFTATPSTSRGGDWLKISAMMSEIPGTIDVSAIPRKPGAGHLHRLDPPGNRRDSDGAAQHSGFVANWNASRGSAAAYSTGGRRIPGHARGRKSGRRRSRSIGPRG